MDLNDRERWFQGYGGGIELVVAKWTRMKWKKKVVKEFRGGELMSSLRYFW